MFNRFEFLKGLLSPKKLKSIEQVLSALTVPNKEIRLPNVEVVVLVKVTVACNDSNAPKVNIALVTTVFNTNST